LLTLHVAKLRQMILCPTILNELERIILAQRMSVPIRRQQNPAQIGMIMKDHTEEIVNFALRPVSARPDARHTLNAFPIRVDVQAHPLIF
jgi:hypothetical protein